MADDVIANFDFMTDPENGTKWAESLAAITEYSKVDDYTLKFKFDEPSSGAKAQLAYRGAPIVSPEARESSEVEIKNKPIGTGPFKLEEWVSGDHITLTKFEDYWEDGYPNLDEVIFRPVTESSVKMTELRKGELDILWSPPLEQIDQLENDPDINVHVQSTGDVHHVHILTEPTPQEGRGPQRATQSKKIRHAIAEAADRHAMFQVAYNGYGTPSQSIYPEGSTWHSDYAPYSMGSNFEKARELIAETDYETPIELHMIQTQGSEQRMAMAKVLQDNLNQVGFDVKLEQLDAGTHGDRFFNFQYDLRVGGHPLLLDPSQQEIVFDPNNVEVQNYDNEKVNELFEKGRETFDLEERKQIYDQIWKIVRDDLPVMMIGHPDNVEAYRKSVKNYTPHPYTNYFRIKDVWVDRNE